MDVIFIKKNYSKYDQKLYSANVPYVKTASLSWYHLVELGCQSHYVSMLIPSHLCTCILLTLDTNLHIIWLDTIYIS